MDLELIICLLQICMNYAHQDVHCNPHSNQICPNGVLCQLDLLDCQTTENGEIYCLCPAYDESSHPHHPHHIVQCDPYSNQICPNGQLCDHHSLECREDDDNMLYCMCPTSARPAYDLDYYYESSFDHPHHRDHSHRVHCHPYSNQICPNGQLCDRHSLDCREDGDILYCVCPTSVRPAVTSVGPAVPSWPVFKVHCNPGSFVKQICPSGDICDSNYLDCEIDKHHNIEYCVCPADHSDDVHCNPYSHPAQVCPGGHLCSPNVLQCTRNKKNHLEWDYCECPKYYLIY